MNLLIYAQLRDDLPLPDFGAPFLDHMRRKTHPAARSASLSAWNLLAEGLHGMGINSLPEAQFAPSGKPCFKDSPLHFSLSHSHNIAAALISDAPCGVDVEIIAPETADKLRARCLSPREQAENRDFFEIWTKKEAVCKLLGKGLPARPETIEISDFAQLNWTETTIADSHGNRYRLCAVCESPDPISMSVSFFESR